MYCNRRKTVKNRLASLLFMMVSLLMAVILTINIMGCKTDTTGEPEGSVDEPGITETLEPEDTAVVLTVSKGEQSVSYTMTALKALPSITGEAGQMSSTGTISGPFNYTGVTLSQLLEAVGGITDENAVRVTAKDGYAMTLSYRQLTEGNFTIIDSSTGKETTAEQTPVVFVAYEEAGQPIGEERGPLRLGIMTSGNQVTEGHWWVKWTQKIEVISVEKPWTLNLEGVITENMDPATFESGSAIGCHGVKWTDDQNRVWEGIPLWYLVGRVDDTNTHKGDAFDTAAAETGYEVHLIAADGYTVKLTSQEVAKNNALIIAYKRDGAPLPENQWPLRLVGATLDKGQMVGQIAAIKLVFDGEGEAAAPETTGEAVVTITKGTENTNYTMAEIKAMTALSGYAGTKNKAGVITGPVPYKGVSLTVLLADLGGIPVNGSVRFTASDGYAKTLTYDQISQGTFTTYDATGTAVDAAVTPVVFLAYESDGADLPEGTGPLQLAIMTSEGQVTDGSNFVKNVVSVEILEAE